MAWKTSEEVVTPQELADAFTNTNFGGVDHRELLHASVIKKACGYHCGHTITCIMKELRLINRSGDVLKRGKDLMRSDRALHALMLKSG
jgi:hypothetical protein